MTEANPGAPNTVNFIETSSENHQSADRLFIFRFAALI